MSDSVDDSKQLEQDLEQVRADILGEPGDDIGEALGDDLPPDGGRRDRAVRVVESIMTSTEVIPMDLRSRLIDGVDALLAQTRLRKGRLEPLLRARRRANEWTTEDLAGRSGLDLGRLVEIEDGKQRLSRTEGDRDFVARWMLALDADNGEAVAALQRSIGSGEQPTRAYAGLGEEPQYIDEWVLGVVNRLKELKEQRDDPSSL